MSEKRPTQMRRRTVTEAVRILHPEKGVGLRRVSITAASGNSPQVAIALFPYAPMLGDIDQLDDAGSFNRMEAMTPTGATLGKDGPVAPGSLDDLGRSGKSYLMPVFDANMLDLCVTLTEDQYIEAQAVNTGYATLVITVEYLD